MLAQQFHAMARIKFLMIRSSFKRVSPLGRLLLGILLFFFLLLSLAVSALLYYLAGKTEAKGNPTALFILLDGAASIYLFFFLWSLLMELQRGEGIGMDKLLSLPIRPWWIYLFNFLLFSATPLFFFSLPPFLALVAGFYKGFGLAALFWMTVFTLLFIGALNAWAYYLCGILALWMVNRRRRRVVFVILPVAFVALAQMPAMLLRLFLNRGQGPLDTTALESWLPGLLSVHRQIPFLWPINGLWNSLTGTSTQALWLSLAGSAGLILAGLYLGYVTVLRYYQSGHSESPEEKGGTKQRALPESSRPEKAVLRPSFFSAETRQLTLTFFYSYWRHPHMRMLFLMPASMGLFVIFLYQSGGPGGRSYDGSQWIPHFWLFLPFFNFSFFFFNVFGIDGLAFQTLMLLPAPRYRYLLAKNLALAPFVFGLSFFLFATIFFLKPLTSGEVLIVLFLVLHLFLLFSATGNLYSLYFPEPVRRDAMRAPISRLHLLRHMLILSVLTTALVLPASLCFAFRRSTVLPAPWGDHEIFTGLTGALILLLLSCIYYRGILYRAGNILHEREQFIFAILARENE